MKIKTGIAVTFAFLLAAVIVGDAGAALASQVPAGGGGKTLGSVITNLRENTDLLPNIFSWASYMAGAVFGMMGIVKIKQHVENPNQVPAWDFVKRLAAGGAFFSLPFIMDVVRTTLEGSSGDSDLYENSGFNGSSSGAGLDAMIVKLMTDVFVPLQGLFGWFGYIAGIMLVMVGISRLLKTEQEGPRGPTGLGTIMTFVIAGCLFSINSMIGYFTTTLFGDNMLNTNGTLQYTDGLGDAANHVHAVISAVIAFSIVIGWVSLIRGFFIMRGVSEGSSQASMMAAMTHLIGGVLAINLGGIIMAVQRTLGITQYGINFS